MDEELPISKGIEGQLSNPLSEASDDDLLNELKRRHHAVLLCTLDNLHSPNPDIGDELCKTFFDGGLYTCVGMAQYFINHALNG